MTMSNGETEPARLHHIAIQTNDLDNSIAWYRDFFGGSVSWTLEEFSELTRRRLPGIVRLAEVVAGGSRFHLFSRDGVDGGPPAGTMQYQHVCMAAGSPAEVERWRARWRELYDSGRYAFARPDPPTEIVVDAEGVHSFYTYDVNGLEYEFTFDPNERR